MEEEEEEEEDKADKVVIVGEEVGNLFFVLYQLYSRRHCRIILHSALCSLCSRKKRIHETIFLSLLHLRQLVFHVGEKERE